MLILARYDYVYFAKMVVLLLILAKYAYSLLHKRMKPLAADGQLIARHPERARLRKALESEDSEFIAIYGRRRVGKTFLVRQTAGKRLLFDLTGSRKGNMHDQLRAFAIALGDAFYDGVAPQAPGSWSEALQMLKKPLSKRRSKQKKVLFFDELPWLATPRSRCLEELEHFWNSWLSKRSDIVLIVCGSAASWMIQKIVEAKGGLHNRLTDTIRLEPFSLGETREYLRSRRIQLTDKQILELYMVVGGIPYYLRHVERGLSVPQIIDHLCFSSSGILYREYDRLFASLFGNRTIYETIVNVLVRNPSGISRDELLNRADLSSGGGANQILRNLEEAGFIASTVPFMKRKSGALYRLIDEFVLFHAKWMRHAPRAVLKGGSKNYWIKKSTLPSRRAWSGFAFEALALKHIDQIKEAMGIGAVHTMNTTWRYAPVKNDGESGAQVDLLIDRADGTISLIELKFSNDVFAIDKKYAQELRNKIQVFKRVTKTRKSVHLVFLTTHGLKQNRYYAELVDAELLVNTLF